MSTISTSIQMHNGMTPALRNMSNALNIVLSSFESLQQASGNSIDVSSIQAARNELNQAEIAFNSIEHEIRDANVAQRQLNDEIGHGQVTADGLASSFKKVVSSFIGIAAIKRGVSEIRDWLGLADLQIASEKQLATVMRNMGAARAEFESIKMAATDIQIKTTYGGDDLLGGAGELATYLKSGEAIEAMMGTLSNYAAGMGGMEVNKHGMIEYATQLGKALDGQFDGLRKKGFDVTDIQKKIIETGTEMERVAVITDIINQSWNGLAESLANTPQGQLIQMGNTWDDIRTTMGIHLYPAILKFFNILNSNMPQAEQMMMGFAYAATVVIEVLGRIVNVAGSVASFFINNWGWISPVIWGVVGVLGVYLAATEGVILAQSIGTAITGAYHAAQTFLSIGFGVLTGNTAAASAATLTYNSALLASPITWVVMGIIALIAVVYAAVAAVNKFAGTSISATGVIAGAFMWLMALIGNIVIGTLNSIIQMIWSIFVEPFIGIVEWILNVANGGFDSFGGAVANLIGNIISWFLSLGKVVTKIIDSIFGTDWTSGLSSLQDNVLAWGKNDNAITLDRDAPTIDARIEYGVAWDAGYNWGENLATKMSLFNSNGADYDNIMAGIGDIAGNTGAIKDSLEISEEDLKYLRDLAEREIIDRTVLRDVTFEVSNTFGDVRETADVDGIITRIEEKLTEAIESDAEGDWDV